MTSKARTRYHDAMAFWLEKTIAFPHGPGIGIVGGSIGLMPTLPPVRLALGPIRIAPPRKAGSASVKSPRLRKTIRTISPKPSVTIAR